MPAEPSSGFTLPLAPGPRGSVVSHPPWSYAGDVVHVEFHATAAAFHAFLLPPLVPAAENPHLVQLAFSWMSGIGAGYPAQAVDEPEAANFSECLVKLLVTLHGRTGWFVSHSWVSNDVTLVRGILQGFPKRLGHLAMTRFDVPASPAGGRSPGARIGCSLSTPAGLTVRAAHLCDAPIPTDAWKKFPFLLRRHWPDLHRPGQAVYDEWVTPVVVNSREWDAWAGPGELFATTPDAVLQRLLQPVDTPHSRSFRCSLEIHGTTHLAPAGGLP